MAKKAKRATGALKRSPRAAKRKADQRPVSKKEFMKAMGPKEW